MNRPVYLGLSILELRKIVMYEFWYHNLKLKYKEKTILNEYRHFFSINENRRHISRYYKRY